MKSRGLVMGHGHSVFLPAAVAVVVASAAVVVPAAVRAQAAPSTMYAAASAANAKRSTPEQREEWRFLKEAAAAGRFENEAAGLALSRSTNPFVRQHAAAAREQHAAGMPALQQMLYLRSMAEPMLAADQRKVLNRLAKLHGAKFDREYIDEVALRAGSENLASFERASGAMRDPAIKLWVDRSLPTMRAQLASADRVVPGASTRLARQAPTLTAPAKPVVVQAVAVKTPVTPATRSAGPTTVVVKAPAATWTGAVQLGPTPSYAPDALGR